MFTCLGTCSLSPQLPEYEVDYRWVTKLHYHEYCNTWVTNTRLLLFKNHYYFYTCPVVFTHHLTKFSSSAQQIIERSAYLNGIRPSTNQFPTRILIFLLASYDVAFPKYLFLKIKISFVTIPPSISRHLCHCMVKIFKSVQNLNGKKCLCW